MKSSRVLASVWRVSRQTRVLRSVATKDPTITSRYDLREILRLRLRIVSGAVWRQKLAISAFFFVLGSPFHVLAADLPNAAPTHWVKGVKWPNSQEEGEKPVVNYVRSYDPAYALDATDFNELIPYVLASPDQEEAGSCLYMSLTGVAEWWLARLNPLTPRTPDGPIDLSERYLMNLAGTNEDANQTIPNWRTDSIYLFNVKHQSVLNTSYRFTRSWYVETSDNELKPAQPDALGAMYDTKFNWIDQRYLIKDGFTDLPHFTRNIIFADPEADQWNVGVAPSDIVEKIKVALTHRRAPVHVIYNHFGYWHAVMVVGFNDEISNEKCEFVTRTNTFMHTEPSELRRQAQSTNDAQHRQALLNRAARYEKTGQKLDNAFAKLGGCHGDKGVFYVRDSIYPGVEEPIYIYDESQKNKQDHYSKKIILHEYDWLLYLANHFVQIDAQLN